MRTNFFRVILLTALAALLAALGYSYAVLARARLDGLLLAAPKNGSAAAVGLDDIEEINESKCLVTYECAARRTVKGLSARHDVVWKGTNASYPFVMSKPLISGGFLTPEAVKRGGAVAVLNQRAAFDIFGELNAAGNTLYLDDKPYTVVGVINDGDEDSLNVYAPAALFSDPIGAFMAKLDAERGVSAEFVEIAMKSAGVTAADYDLLNLDVAVGFARERTVAALWLAAGMALFFAARQAMGRFLAALATARERVKSEYLAAMLRKNPMGAAKLAAVAALAAAVTGGLIRVLFGVAEIFLKWKAYGVSLSGRGFGAFEKELQALQQNVLLADALFIAFCATLALYLAYELRPRRALWD